MRILIIFLTFALGHAIGKHLGIDSVTTKISWPQFYKNYIQPHSPVVFQKACTNEKAYRLWSADYIYYHPGAAIAFRNWTKSSLSIRKLIEHRDEIEKLHFRMPQFLTDDLRLNSFLECELLISNIKTPMFLWHFEPTSVNVQLANNHEVWCVLKGSITVTLIPAGSPNLANQFITNEMFTTEKFQGISFYQSEIKAGDCWYVPEKFQRQYKPEKDTMGVIYEIPESVLEKNKKKLEECKVLTGDYWVEFSDEDLMNEEEVHHSGEMRLFISYLGKSSCIDFSLFLDSMINDPELQWLDRKSTREVLAKEVFDAFDQNHDGQFCWDDVDTWTLQTANQLAKLIKTKQVVRHSSWREFNRKAAKKIQELGTVDFNDPRFLETIGEHLFEQYGDKMGNLFDGPAHRELWEDMDKEEEKKDKGGKKKHMHAKEL